MAVRKKRKKYRKVKTNRGDVKKRDYRRDYGEDYFHLTIDVPENFSIVENTEQSMEFYLEMYNLIKENPPRTHFFINSSHVKSVSVDALVFLLASILNTKLNKKKFISYRGNCPMFEEAKRVFAESGFIQFFSSNMRVMPEDNEKMKIISGMHNSPMDTKAVCQFVMESLGIERTDILDIQKIMIELMSNVYTHAYTDDGMMEPKWYVYAEHTSSDCVRLIFADTGLGIASTIYKKFYEKIVHKKDCELLYSAFSTDDFRTETRERNRGNGLPGIKEIVMGEKFKSFCVITGKGELKKSKSEKDFIKIEHKNKLNGTLYVFDYIK